MPLESVVSMLKHAIVKGYAVGYFESWNFESLQGIIDAAEQSKSPVIIGFNGEYLSQPRRTMAERLSWYAALGKAAAESASVSCGLVFNECGQDDWVKNAAQAGFNLVMPIDINNDFDDYLKRTQDITQYAHSQGVAVEAELGELPNGIEERQGYLTDPEKAAKFIKDTSVDMLSVSVGNVHVTLSKRKGLNFDLIATLRERLPVPLVLHGGTGIVDDELQKAISMGVAKVNYGTYLKERYLAAVRQALKSDCKNPHKLLGYGGEEDVLVAGRGAVRDAVLERIGLLGCCGKS